VLAGAGIPFVPRGAGTSLSGGTLVPDGAVVVGLSRMRRLLEIDRDNGVARVEAGLVNLSLTRAVQADGLHYAPDPSSQSACTIGGNVATNSGGPHTLKYGVTTNHVLGLTLVTPTGEIVELGGAVADTPGLDLVGLVVGSEGTFGIVTEATVRLLRTPPAVRTFLVVFDAVEAASRAISSIIAAGIVPAALEMMDRLIIRAVEEAYGLGLPLDAGAVLLIELDGLEAGFDAMTERIDAICRDCGRRELRVARDADERQRLWTARKRAFGAVGRLAPNYCTQDGVVPRTRIPEMLRRIEEIGKRYELTIPNVFHAGDGNMHPILLYDERRPEMIEHVLQASEEILAACIELGGTVSGEHGIGVEKISMMSRLFSAEVLDVMRLVRDVFNPHRLCNPNKVLATGAGSCLEVQRPARQAPV
jgi:glycolate oxidase